MNLFPPHIRSRKPPSQSATIGPKNKQQSKAPRPTERKHGKPQNQQSTSHLAGDLLPLKLKQEILNVFSSAFPLAGRNDLPRITQEVKSHLYNRDFTRAFGIRTTLMHSFGITSEPDPEQPY